MRKGSPSSSRLIRWAVVAAITALQGGCEKKEPVSAEPPPAMAPATSAPPPVTEPEPATPVPPGESFVLSNVRFRYDEGGLKSVMSYEVENRGDKRERVYVCVDFIDKDGYFVERGGILDWFSLRPGHSDQGVDKDIYLVRENWTATEVLRFYVDNGPCLLNSDKLRSTPFFLDKRGQPLPPGTQPELKESEADGLEVGRPWFRLEGVRLSQNDLDEVSLEYKVTNLTKGRASSKVCVRLTQDVNCCRGLDEAQSNRFNLGLAASERRLAELSLHDNQNWGEGRYLIIYTAALGCSDPPERATSNVLTLAKPRSIHAPVRPLEEEAE